MRVRYIVLISILIVANVLVAGWLVVNRGNPDLHSRVTPIQESSLLPVMDLQDDRKQIISTKNLIGSPLFVQFIDPRVDAQVNAILNILKNRPNHPLTWLFITDNASLLRSRLPGDDTTIVEKEYDALLKIFGVRQGLEHWFIFDEAGKLKAQGRYDSGDAIGRLHSIVDGQPGYSAALFLESLDSLNESGKLSELRDKCAKVRSGKAVFVLFSSVCTGCAEASLIEIIISYAKRYPHIWFEALLPNTFARQDIDNLKANLDLAFPVELASDSLSQEWLALSDRYGEKEINGTVFVLDRQGVISAANGLSETKSLLERIAGEL